LCIAVENGWYHVLNRGIDGRQLFPDNRANEHFLELLKSMPARFDLPIHAFVLMGNHYHLQIETLKPDLSRAIQWLTLSFSGWYNRLHRRRGPLFQGRFKAVLHDPEESALIINRYIHLNPVRIKRLGGHEARAGAVQRLGPAAEQVNKELVRARSRGAEQLPMELVSGLRWQGQETGLAKHRIYPSVVRQPILSWRLECKATIDG
jgi:REP element-mobilizing transposase RayT